jgi:hypothetical protein
MNKSEKIQIEGWSLENTGLMVTKKITKDAIKNEMKEWLRLCPDENISMVELVEVARKGWPSDKFRYQHFSEHFISILAIYLDEQD